MKKSHRRFHIIFWLLVLAGVLWLVLAPVAPRAPVSIQVKVEQPDVFSSGDEKAQPQVMPSEKLQEKIPSRGGPPKIAIVIDDVGLDIKDSKRAIDLPASITLSFLPYAPQLREQTHDARDHGHELLLHMPMEPMGHDNPGPGALLTSLPPNEIRQRFQAALASFVGFDGVNNHMGSKFTADAAGMEIVIDELHQRGLFFLDSRTSAQTVGEDIARQHGLPTIRRDIFLDDVLSPAAIKAQLEQTEIIARRKGYAVAIGHPHTATLDALEAWLPEAKERDFSFVPVRDVVGP